MDITFEQFYEVYPRKQNGKRAKSPFKRLSKAKKQKAFDDCQTRYTDTPKQFIPHPASYINGERWEDEVITPEVSITFPRHNDCDAWVRFAAGHGIKTIPGERQGAFENRVRNRLEK